MCENKEPKPVTPPADCELAEQEPQQSAQEVQVQYGQLPRGLPRGKKIHPRQVIPMVPEGKETPDDTPSPPVELD